MVGLSRYVEPRLGIWFWALFGKKVVCFFAKKVLKRSQVDNFLRILAEDRRVIKICRALAMYHVLALFGKKVVCFLAKKVVYFFAKK